MSTAFQGFTPASFYRKWLQVVAKLVELLCRPSTIARLHVAASTRRPPAEAVQLLLLQELPEIEAHSELRKLVGHMLRRLMTHLGYRLRRRRASIPGGILFTAGAVYW